MATAVTSVDTPLAQTVPEGDPAVRPLRTGQPSQRHWGFPGRQWSPSSDDGPTQRASGSCGTCLPLILWLKKALVPAFPDERGPFRGSKATAVPPATTLPRASLQAREQAMGVQEKPGGTAAGHGAAHLGARTPSCVAQVPGRRLLSNPTPPHQAGSWAAYT